MTLTSCRRPKMTKDCKRNAASDFVQTHIYSGYGYIQNSLLFLQFLSYKDISGKEFILCFFKIQLLCFFNESLNHFTDLYENSMMAFTPIVFVHSTAILSRIDGS